VFDGWCVTRGFDPLELPFDRFCNIVYFWLVQGRDEEDVRQLDLDLNAPLPGRPDPASGPWEPQEELAAFQAAQAAVSG
jgi:hypothetical protein